MATLTLTTTHLPAAPTTAEKIGNLAQEIITGDFGLKDERGRAVGGTITIITVDFRWEHGVRVACEPYYRFVVQATRNGKKYGASQPGHDAPNQEAARAAGLAILQAQAARYAKKYQA